MLSAYALIAALDDVELAEDEEDEELLEGEPVATVKTCPAKDVVVPEAVASVIAGPPTEVTSTTGAPLTA